jgi:ribosomal protein S3
LGQKVNPIGLRLGINKSWSSKWFAEKKYGDLVHQDIKLRKFLKKKFYHAGISRIEIERAADKAKVNIHAARPGIIIGKKGSEIEKLKKELDGMTGGETIINIMEVRKPEIDAQLVAENVALQLERRIAFRRAMKKSVTSALKFGARASASPARAVSAERRCPGRNGTARAKCPCTPCEPTSTTALPRRGRPTGPSGSRCSFIMGTYCPTRSRSAPRTTGTGYEET